MPIQEKPRIDVSDAAIYKRCGTNSDEMPVLVATEITYIDKDVTGDGIKEKLAKYTEKKWTCPKLYQEKELGVEIVQFGTPKDITKGVVKNSGGNSFTINDVALIGSDRYYVFAIPAQTFEDIPAPDEIRIVLIPEKTLDKIRLFQTSDDSVKLQKKLEELQKKDPETVDKDEAQKLLKQLREGDEKIRKMVAETVVAKHAGDIEKAGDLPLPKGEKEAFTGMISLLRNDRNFAATLIRIAFTNLAQEEVAAD